MCGLFKCVRCRAVTERQPNSVSSLYLTLQSVYLSGQLHGVSAEVVHGDGVVPVTEVVLLTWRLFLPPHAAHSQQHSYSGQREKNEAQHRNGNSCCFKKPLKSPTPAARQEPVMFQDNMLQLEINTANSELPVIRWKYTRRLSGIRK